jgi:DNA primase large subunit
MRILLQEIKEGKKLTHIGRFALVTYLRVKGWSVEDIINLFRTLPDFKEDITRYQIEHIFGLRGGRKVYSVPSCLTMKVANLCFPESPNCDNIKHPLQFKQKKKWKQK